MMGLLLRAHEHMTRLGQRWDVFFGRWAFGIDPDDIVEGFRCSDCGACWPPDYQDEWCLNREAEGDVAFCLARVEGGTRLNAYREPICGGPVVSQPVRWGDVRETNCVVPW